METNTETQPIKQPETNEQQNTGETSRVSPFDPDFLVMLAIAFVADALDIVLELTGLLIIPKVLGILFDGFTFVMISGWMYMRLHRIAQTREQQKTAMRERLQLQQLSKGATKNPLRRVLTRGLAVALGELLPFVGLFPFWTITVISTLREK